MTHVEVLDARSRPRQRLQGGRHPRRACRPRILGMVLTTRPTSAICPCPDLFVAVHGRTERSRTRTVESAAIQVEASRDDAERLALIAARLRRANRADPLELSASSPAWWARRRPTFGSFRRALAGINLQYGLTSHRAEQVKTLEIEDGRVELRAVTGPDYGRIFDHELVEAVQRIAGNGTGDTRWKVPGVLDWSTGVYNPRVDITQDKTTLYASDRDVFLFLVDDLNPDRGRPAARWFARSLLPRLLLLEFRGWRQDAWHGELLSPRGLPEPQSLGRRGFRGDHHPPLQIRRLALRP